MTDPSYQDGCSSTTDAVAWSLSRTLTVIWCRNPTTWRRVQRWSFVRPFAHAWQQGQLVAVGLVIPTRKVRFAYRALGLPIVERLETPRQRAYRAALRRRGARGALFPSRQVHERRSTDDGIARAEAQP